MNRQQTTDEEEAFELIDGKMVLRDQHKYVVPMRALDAMQRDIARTFGKIHDGHGNAPGHRPGFVVSDNADHSTPEYLAA